MPRKTILVAFAIVAIAFAWFAWSRIIAPTPIRAGACGGCNVLLITIDTLRSDRVGSFGGPPDLTPNLDRLAAQGLRFSHAYSSAPLTLPSHSSIMTGVSPPVHGVRTNGLFRLGQNLPTLATILGSQGYRTGAFVGAFVLDARFGLNRGFDVYDDRYGEKHPGDETEGAERRAEEVIKPATAWILHGEAAPGTQHPAPSTAHPAPSTQHPAPGGRWFAWIHLYDPHEPYRAPDPYASQHEPYDAEVAYTDAMLGKLLDDLSRGGQLDRTLVIVVADHGESLGEHGERTHGVFAYDVTLRVPWLIWTGPDVTFPRGQSYGGVVRLIDLAPTMLDLIAVAMPATFEGRSVLTAVTSGDTRTPPLYFEAMDATLTRNWAPLTGILSGDFKLIELPLHELYDVSADPHETTNLYSHQADRARLLEKLLRDATARLAASASAPQQMTLSAESRQRLQALGYVAPGISPGPRVYTDADDPKILIAPSNELSRATLAFKSGQRTEAMTIVRTIIQQHPAFTSAYGIYASMQRDSGSLPAAIATLEDVVRRGIADPSVIVVLAGYFQEAGKLEESAALLDAVIASHSDYAEAYNSLGVVCTRLGQHERAQAALKKVLELDPTSATAYENLGVDELAVGDLVAAASDLTRALDLDPKLAGAHNVLAAVYARQGRGADAFAHWQAAVQLNPRLYDALYNLGTALYAAGRRDEARPYLERFINEAPPIRYAADIAKLRGLLARQ